MSAVPVRVWVAGCVWARLSHMHSVHMDTCRMHARRGTRAGPPRPSESRTTRKKRSTNRYRTYEHAHVHACCTANAIRSYRHSQSQNAHTKRARKPTRDGDAPARTRDALHRQVGNGHV